MTWMGFVLMVLLALFAMMAGAAAMVTSGLRRRVSVLEAEVASLERRSARSRPQTERSVHERKAAAPAAQVLRQPAQAPAPVVAAAEVPAAEVPEPPRVSAEPQRTFADRPRAVEPLEPPPRADARFIDDRAAPAPRRRELEVDESSLEVTSSLGASVRAWFTGGNTIVRVAMLILLVGVGFLVRYAAERGWFPLELRLACAALGGAACAFVGWRLRELRRGYALTLQGGGIAIVFIVVFAAFRLYGLLHAGPAFVLLAALAALTAFLATAQNALPLAVLGLAGAFLAPVLASTSRGNHVALFGWYALINVAVAWLATRKPWKLLNTLGFTFTAGVALAWGASRWTPDLLPSTEPFLLLHLALYLFITVQYARRIAASETGPSSTRPQLALVDAGLLFGVPLAAFGMQFAMLRHVEYGVAASAAAFAAVYLVLARWLWVRLGEPQRLLTEGMLALGVVFLSLVAPYALEGPWIAMAWALQATGMVWMALRQRRPVALVLGVLLLLLSAAALGAKAVPRLDLVGAIVLGAAAFVSAWLLARHGERVVGPSTPLGTDVRGRMQLDANVIAGMHALVLVIAVASLLAGPWVEIAHGALGSDTKIEAAMLWAVVLGLGFDALRPRLQWPALGPVARAMALTAAVVWAARMGFEVFDRAGDDVWRIYREGGVATAVAMAAAVLWLLRRSSRADGRVSPAEVVVWGGHLLVHAAVLALGLTVAFIAREGSWPAAMVLAAPLALMAVMLVQQRRGRWPFRLHASVWHQQLAWPLLGLGLLWMLFVDLWSDASMRPLPYLPIFNPIDLMHVALAVTALRLARHPLRPAFAGAKHLAIVLGGAGFVWLSSMLVRTLHHWAGSPLWLDGAFGSSTVQTGLSVLWTTLALATMAHATRRGMRAVWMVGAALLAVVVAKLLLVDLSQTAAALRIVSFIGVGVLMLVIGYLAPLPPQARADRLEEQPA
jgi:uncharacterized membrane protein